MDKCFEMLNSQSEYIKFTCEEPRANWLPFLDVQSILIINDPHCKNSIQSMRRNSLHCDKIKYNDNKDKPKVAMCLAEMKRIQGMDSLFLECQFDILLVYELSSSWEVHGNGQELPPINKLHTVRSRKTAKLHMSI
ncbi:hypothetical protein KIN20_032449 [Parelaphostrongylus tenuis]|uniref:Uncharacterized protein n=1 Tax=Parelaphostrongylus tenuis TaxID=148309 RepID=A0AAD5R8T8_PARTN|nr:hypothetical protein KIN20_032449 [Parelaphostrongylus tenuis]